MSGRDRQLPRGDRDEDDEPSRQLPFRDAFPAEAMPTAANPAETALERVNRMALDLEREGRLRVGVKVPSLAPDPPRAFQRPRGLQGDARIDAIMAGEDPDAQEPGSDG